MIASKLTAKAAMRAGNKSSTVIRPLAVVVWSGNMSFSSPESDFYHNAIHQEPTSAPAWSHTLSFSSPEADFAHAEQSATDKALSHEEAWSGSFSFASPEADFSANPEAPAWEWSHNLSFASPETDFQAATLRNTMHEAEQAQSDNSSLPADLFKSAVMGLAIASPESASGSIHAHNYLEHHHMHQLHQHRNVDQQEGLEPLPTSLQEALSASESRAIVVTEAHSPFQIVDVNDAWVGLCGYSKEEARHSSLNIIQGSATNTQSLDFMLQDLLHGKESQTLVTNYTKTGRKFYNKLRAGPIHDSNDRITHFVGVLTEVTEDPDYFRMDA